MYSTFAWQDELFTAFKGDNELCRLLNIYDTDDIELLDTKLRREDLMPELFDPNVLDFIAFYFVDADRSNNYLLNRGLLRLDIYSGYRSNAAAIRERCAKVIHDCFDIRIVAEGQIRADVRDVYKYRLELLPLITT